MTTYQSIALSDEARAAVLAFYQSAVFDAFGDSPYPDGISCDAPELCEAAGELLSVASSPVDLPLETADARDIARLTRALDGVLGALESRMGKIEVADLLDDRRWHVYERLAVEETSNAEARATEAGASDIRWLPDNPEIPF